MLPSYAVRIKGRVKCESIFCGAKLLPEKEEFEDHRKLEARLTQHLTMIAEHETEVKADCDIASMHFGLAEFEKYEIMLALDNLILEGEVKSQQLRDETQGTKSWYVVN